MKSVQIIIYLDCEWFYTLPSLFHLETLKYTSITCVFNLRVSCKWINHLVVSPKNGSKMAPWLGPSWFFSIYAKPWKTGKLYSFLPHLPRDTLCLHFPEKNNFFKHEDLKRHGCHAANIIPLPQDHTIPSPLEMAALVPCRGKTNPDLHTHQPTCVNDNHWIIPKLSGQCWLL